MRFPINLATEPGTEVVIRLAEDAGEVFGWRYTVNLDHTGRALLLGRDDGQYDFLYKIHP